MEEKKDNKKKIIILAVITFIIILLSTSFAFFVWNSSSNQNINVALNLSGLDAYIHYNKGTDVLTGTLLPSTDYSGGISTEIELWKNPSAASRNIYGHIYLDITTIGTNLANEPALKWAVTSNGEVLNTGNFIGKSQGNSIGLKLNIPLNTTKQLFKIYIWLDESMEINDVIEGETISTIVRAEATEQEYVHKPNLPDLLEGLIPVKYNGSTWVKADETNGDSTYQWYDYDSQMWANAVLVSDSSRATYESASMGTAINESDVLAYYVWVPRYKYKLFNAEKVEGVDSYDAQNTGIDIVFENGTESTGTVSCTVGTNGNENCTGVTNEAYYTHPAFTFGNAELTGIWVGKFELTGSTGTPTVKPNVSSLRSINVSTMSTTIAKISGSSNTYGVNSSEADSHMMKNMEWGAVAYLSNSKYGRCPNGSCTEIGINNNSSYTTGCGAVPGSGSSSSCNAYTTSTGMLASTTGNIYGIYDMSGGAFEYVMGNMVSNDGSTMMSGNSTIYHSGYNGILYASGSYTQYSSGIAYPESKYYDRYPFSASPTAGTRGHLGDATSEVVVSGDAGWNSDFASFVYSEYPWSQRGGYYNSGSYVGTFYFRNSNGIVNGNASGRAVLVRD